MASPEPFNLVEREERRDQHRLMDDVLDLNSAIRADQDLQCLFALRKANEGMIVTTIPLANISLRTFAAAGFATCELDLDTDSFASFRGFTGPDRGMSGGALAESVHFAKYRYHWAGEDFILYTVDEYQYVLKERRDGEDILGPSKITDALVLAIGNWMIEGVVWVFDGYWYQDKNLYQQVQKMSWDKVILDETVKKELKSVADKFFASKDIYDDLGVPWKRGLMWHGPPGNGKTVSIKALMHTLLDRKIPIPTLYVKNAPQTYQIQSVFVQARRLAPCMLVLEDIETIVTPATRSYFFNQMDGLEDNSGLFVVATTNFLDKLDPGLTKRPSRFDRKYLFPIPNEHERYLYCQYWQRKLANKPDIEFPDELCKAMAKITDTFSFAYLQECFVATLLILAQQEDEEHGQDLDDHPMWIEFRNQLALLQKQIGGISPRKDEKHDKDLNADPSWIEFQKQAALLQKQIDMNKRTDGTSPQKDEKPGQDLDNYPLWIEFKKQAALLKKQIDETSPEIQQDQSYGTPYAPSPLPPSGPSAPSLVRSNRTNLLFEDPLARAIPSLSIRDDKFTPALGIRKNETFTPTAFEKR